MTADPYAWPVLRTYDQRHSPHVALPLGGIGTGTVSLGGRGDLRDWEVVNRPSKGFSPRWSFFAIRTATAEGEVTARALEGQLDLMLYEGAHGSRVANHGLPRFRGTEFAAAYPFGQVHLTDPDVPVSVRLQAFNPMVPTEADTSGIPVAMLRYVVTNETDQPLEISLAGSLENFVGTDGVGGKPERNRNESRADGDVTGVFGTTDGVDPSSERWGSLALAVLGEQDVTTRTAWAQAKWSGALLDFWDDFTGDGRLDERDGTGPSDSGQGGPVDAPMASVAASRRLGPGETGAVTFLLGWHFPNRRGWDGEDTVGNYYTTRYADAWQAITDTAPRLEELENRTVEFVDTVCGSDLPDAVKEAGLFNLSTLRTQTCFRTADGRFFGWEGCNDDSGCCQGSCTHVWNYEQATPYLFGALARSAREVEFAHGTRDDGLMCFRIGLPLATKALKEPIAAADGQLGALVKLYREWRLSGDEGLLRSLWPSARKALEFCWIPGGWDADRDGVMEGCQHNTMDVEYFGPNPQMGAWYLAALRACEEMARHLGEREFADQCADLFRRGSAWMDANLFNGDYYRHEIRPPHDASAIAEGLRLGAGATDLDDPQLQLGDGCLTDQLVGQFLAHVSGLGYLLDPDHVRTTLRSILRYNHLDSFAGHFNHMRSYVLGDEQALLMATYPRGNRPKQPFSYVNEVMTGFEYTAGVGLLYEGQVDQGLGVIETVRSRYDGLRRNPFDEAECGHHYVRAMASWGAVLALTGFAYDGITGTIRFAAAESERRWFFATGDAWGVMTQRPGGDGTEVNLEVRGGSVRVRAVELTGLGSAETGERMLTAGDPLTVSVPATTA